MNRLATLLIGSALTALITSTAFAKDQAPVAASPAAAAAVQAPATGSKEQAIKLGAIEMTKVAAQSKTGKAAEASLKAKSGKLRSKIEAKQKQIEKQKAAIEAKLSTMSDKERAAKAKEFQAKLEEYQKLVRSSEQEMQQMQEKVTIDIYNTIKKAAASYAKSHGYSAVLEEKAILYTADTLKPTDLTNEIAALLDEKEQKKEQKK